MSYDPSNAHAALLFADLCVEDPSTAATFLALSREEQAGTIAAGARHVAPDDACLKKQVDQACTVIIDLVWRGANMLRERIKGDTYKLSYRSN